MKVNELFEGHAPTFDKSVSHPLGSVKDWMDELNISKDDIAQALVKVKELPEFKKLKDQGIIYKTKPASEKNGTLTFDVKRSNDYTGKPYDGYYMVYANGLIRTGSNDSMTRLKSPKPRIKPNDPVTSLVMIYSGAIKELLAKKKNVVK